MSELWINWRDENGTGGRIHISGWSFSVGRHPECDLAISNNKLSREHLIIERSGNGFIVSDRGSSNGTELNHRPLIVPTAIAHGDRANLGGGVELLFEFSDELPRAVEYPTADDAIQSAAVTVDAPPPVEATPENGGIGGFPIWLLIAGPLVVIVLLGVVVTAFVIFGGGQRSTAITDIEPRSRTTERPGEDDDTPETAPSPKVSGSPGESNESVPLPSPANMDQNAKVEQSAASFLRRIAQNDPKAFLTAEQAQKTAAKIKQFSNSSTLAANLESARKNAAALKSLAAAKNLQPQLVTTAALAKLGSNRGDVLQTAQGMADILEKLQTQIGSELFDDCLMMIAAYDQGEKGDFMRLRNTLQDLATKSPESSRAIRSIWFLQKQGKISDAEFEFALRFLAIGTISQNPKEFGVSAEPLVL